MQFNPFSDVRAMLLDPFHPVVIQMVAISALAAAMLALWSGG